MTPSEHGDKQRTQITAVIRANPGIHIRALAAMTGVSWGTCLHHARRLESDGRIASRKLRGLCCFFDLTQGSVSSRLGAALVRNPVRARIARHVCDNPGTIQRDIAEALGMACSVVHRQLIVLEENGLVHRTQAGKGLAVFPSDSLAKTLEAQRNAEPGATDATSGPVDAAPLASGLVPSSWTTVWDPEQPAWRPPSFTAADAPVDLAALGVPA